MRLIDADALELILNTAIEMMVTMAKTLDSEDDPEIQMEIKAYTDILNGVKEQPTIEERKTGRWIDEGQYADFFPHHAFCCSECGHHLLEIEVVYDYCPFCGAKMNGGQDDV